MLKFKKTHSLYQLVKQNSTYSKKILKLINELAGNKDQNSLPASKSDLAEEFAQFFLNKIERIREQFESSPTYHTNNKDVPQLDNFTTMSETNLYKLIMEMPTKSMWNRYDSNKIAQKSSQALHAHSNQNHKPITEYRKITWWMEISSCKTPNQFTSKRHNQNKLQTS